MNAGKVSSWAEEWLRCVNACRVHDAESDSWSRGNETT